MRTSRLLGLLLVVLMSMSVTAQDAGENLFKKNCQACHTIGGGKLVGPDLVGVAEKRDSDWLHSFIRSSQTMIADGDSLAVALFIENNEAIMNDHQHLSDAEIDTILNYITTVSADLPEPSDEVTANVVSGPKYILNLTPMFKMLYWSVVIVVVIVLVVLGNLAVNLANKKRNEDD